MTTLDKRGNDEHQFASRINYTEHANTLLVCGVDDRYI